MRVPAAALITMSCRTESYLLSQHPQIEARLHSELDATLGGRSPRYEDLPRLRNENPTPFGFGPRVCLGASFAMAESVLILATLARRYRLLLGSMARIEPQAPFTLRPTYGSHMVPEPRR